MNVNPKKLYSFGHLADDGVGGINIRSTEIFPGETMKLKSCL